LRDSGRTRLAVSYGGPNPWLPFLLTGPLIPLGVMLYIFGPLLLPDRMLGVRNMAPAAASQSIESGSPLTIRRPPRRIRRPLVIGNSPLLVLVFILPLLAFAPLVVSPANAYLMVIPAIVIVRAAFQRRASDAVLEPDGIRVEGHRRGRAFVRWEEIEDCEVRSTGTAMTIGSSKVPSYALWLALRTGASESIAGAAGEAERQALDVIAESIRAVVKPGDAAAAMARIAPQTAGARVLQCPNCGSPAIPRDEDTVKCAFCGAPIAVTDVIRVSLRTSAQALELRAKEVATIERLLVQPRAIRTTDLQIAVFATTFAAAIVWAMGDHAADALALVCLAAILAAFERSTVFDRRALQGLGGVGAVPPLREGAGAACRICGAPLPAASSASLVQCIACGADNVLDIDVRGATRSSQGTLVSLGEVLRERQAKRRSLTRVVVAAEVIGCVAVVARLSASARPVPVGRPAAATEPFDFSDVDVPIRFDGSAH
jgi:predicted RNA-binding Zn-ribbon protein involved in translation (DUF1610 family)